MRHLKHRVQDPVGPTPTGVAEDIATEEDDDQDDADEMEGQAEDQHVEADDDEIQELSYMPNAGGAESSSGDDSKNDDILEIMRDNPLQPMGGRHGAMHPQIQANDVLARDLGTEPNEASSSESSDEEDGGKGWKEDPDIENSFPHTDHERHVSAKGPRLLSKDSLPSTMDPAEAAPASTHSEGNVRLTQISSAFIKPDARSLPLRVRGKHGKRQKLKTKYANQDEEDRALAMRLLGSAAAQEKAIEDAAAKADKDKELAAQKERRRKQHALAAEKNKEAEELRQTNFKKDIETLDENELGGLGDLDAFVGIPLPGDEIIDALVVCGPWDAIGGRYSWRVKLQPGTTKKGKAVRDILGKWNDMVTEREKRRTRPGSGEGDIGMLEEEKLRAREGELIKSIREPEVIGVVPVGRVRAIIRPGEASGKGKNRGAGKSKRGGKGSKKQRYLS